MLTTEDIQDDLEFPIREMLNLGNNDTIETGKISRTLTAITISSVKSSATPPCFIKTSRKNSESELKKRLGKQEVDFYDFIDNQCLGTHPNIPRCFRHFSSSKDYHYYIVLEDLSDEFVSYQDMDFNDIETWKQAVKALAYFHQLFWNKIPGQTLDLYLGDQEDIELEHIELQKSFIRFRDYSSNRLNSMALEIMEQSIPVMKKISIENRRDLREENNITLVHGDAHERNFLYASNQWGTAHIVDWQFWGFGRGTHDLRHLLGLGLKDELRKHQKDLVKYYHDHLTESNKVQYTWNECWLDYRKGIIDNLFMAVWQFVGFNFQYNEWVDMLNGAVENYIQLECDKILI